jgi:histidinol dehydrogenase
MQCERLALRGDHATLAAELRSLIPEPDSVRDAVATIIADVRARGDEAVVEYTRRFDAPDPAPLRVKPDELNRAVKRLDPAVRAGLELAIANVRRVAEASLRPDRAVEFGGHEVVVREVPVARAAVYAPGGRAPYPSTVVMGAVAAHVAGVPEITVCSPPSATGDVDEVVLAACILAGVRRVYRMGGAQAIAALAYGTESVPAVDVIVGPGNLYVQEAKRQVFGQVGIDGFAGPSDLLVIADDKADPDPIALDLLAQAEHGPGTLVVAASTSAELLDALGDRLKPAPDTGAVARLIHVHDPDHLPALAEAFAPEHIQLIGPAAEQLAPKRAGCVFVGPASATAFGDYIAGSNHVLPTNGAARFTSALSPRNFRRTFNEVRVGDDAEILAQAAAPIARAEGFELHAQSMEARIRDNGAP